MSTSSYSFAQLTAAIEAAAGTSPFTISGADLQSGDITTLLTAFFGQDQLSMTLSSAPATGSDSITVTGTLIGALLGQSAPTISVVFSLPDDQAELVLTQTMADGWKPSQLFTGLANTVFDAVDWSDCSIALTSGGDGSDVLAIPGAAGHDDYPPSLFLVPGLSLSGQAALEADAGPGSGLGALAWLLPSEPFLLSGPIGLPGPAAGQPASPAGGLTSSLASAAITQPVGNFSGAFTLALTAVQLDPVDTSDQVASFALVSATLTPSTTVSQSVAFDVSVRLTGNDQGPLLITGTPNPALSLDGEGMLTLIQEVFGVTFATSPTQNLPSSDTVDLTGVSFSVQTSPTAPTDITLISFAVDLAWGLSAPWTVVADPSNPSQPLVALDSLALTLQYYPASETLGFTADAVATIDSLELDASISMVLPGGTGSPDLSFFISLDEDGPPSTGNLTGMISALGSSNAPSWMTANQATGLTLSGDFLSEQVRMQAAISDTWTWSANGISLGLEQIAFNFAYDGSAGQSLSGGVSAVLDIGGAEVELGASYDSTMGWFFFGGTLDPVTLDVGDLAQTLATDLGMTLPSVQPPQVTLQNFNVSLATGTGEFSLTALCSAEFEVMGQEVGGDTVSFGVQVLRDASGDLTFAGNLWIGANAFELEFQEEGDGSVLSGAWASTDDAPTLSLQTLMSDLGIDLTLPDALDLTLASAQFVYDTGKGVMILDAQSASYGKLLFVAQATSQTVTTPLYAVAIQPTETKTLTRLPQQRDQLAEVASLEITEMQISASNQPLVTAGAAANALVASYPQLTGCPTFPVAPTLPAGATTQVQFGATYSDGGAPTPVALPLDSGTLGGTTSSMVASADAGAQPTPQADNTVWYTVQKSYGPVTIQQIGLSYADQVLWFKISATLGVGPLSLSLDGLAVGSPLTSFAPVFTIAGVGIDCSSPPLQVGGSLINLGGPGEISFEGTLSVQAESFNLGGVGYYGTLGGFTSMFLFAEAAIDIGGPPAFYVTGLAGGFGYNSSVTLPAVAQVQSFPFIAALPNAPFPNANALGGAGATASQALQALVTGAPPTVVPEDGEYWITAGLTFTTYDVIKGQALLMVEAGDALEISLLGVAGAQFPQTGSATYANIQLDLELELEPQQGIFSLEAVLAPGSYVFDPACVLTGGFAFCVWYDPDAHAGDFVLTLGGYNTAFEPPSWYPSVPRLGFHWTVSQALTLQGGAYFALTPSALMLGGALAANYQSGNLTAWFDAYADVLVYWSPFEFEADIGLTIGAAYKLHIFGTTKTVTAELACSLNLWGPPTGGVAKVHWWVFSFSVPFGSKAADPPGGGDWSTVQQVLPNTGTDSAPNFIALQATTGLVGTDTNGAWIVRGGQFGFATSSSVPATSATLGTQSFAGAASFDVFPLGWSGVTAAHALTVTGPNGDASADFTATAVLSDVPSSLWGAPPTDPTTGQLQTPDGANQMVPDQLTGLSVEALAPDQGASGGPMEVATTLAQDLLTTAATLPVVAGAAPAGDQPTNDPDALAVITDPTAGIAGATAAGARTAIFQGLAALGLDLPANDPMQTFAAGIGPLLNAEPLLVPASQELRA